MDKNQFEKQALAHLSRGNNEKALEIYARLLRADPRDRRVRQKLADLYNKTGRPDEAEKHYREVARLYEEDGNFRASISVLTQLRRMKPRDPELIGLLGEAYHNANKPIEAEKLLEQAVNALAGSQPEKAANFITSLLRYRHNDMALKIKQAELLESAKKTKAAYAAYREIIEELRRRGQLMEIGRIAVAALRLQPNADDLLQDAAEAALAQDDPPTALRYLQQAFQKNPRDARTLGLLARSFEATESPVKARHVLTQLASVLSSKGDHAGRLSALQRAAVHGNPEALQAEIDRAQVAVTAAAFRLYELESAAPGDEAELRVCTRAEVFIRYGFPDRARPELEAALAGAPKSTALLAVAAEVAAAQEDIDLALKWSKSLLGTVPTGERARVELRLAVLEGKDPADIKVSEPEPEPDDMMDDDDDLLDDELLDDAPVAPAVDDLDDLDEDLLDDDLLDDEPLDAAPAAFKAPQELDDPFAGDDEDEDDAPRSAGLLDDVFKGGTFAESDPAQFADSTELHDPAEDDRARGLLRLGLPDEARIQVAGRDDLTAVSLRALTCDRGEEQSSLRRLRDVFDEKGVSDPGAPEALYAMCILNARLNKPKLALRFLDLLDRQSPGWREREVKECRLALESLLE